MTTPRVRTEGPPGQGRSRRPSPPEVPAEYGLAAELIATHEGKRIHLEVYGRRSYGDAYIRLIDRAGSMDAGTVARGGTTRATVTWTAEACKEYDKTWLDEQAGIIKERLTERWRAS